MKATFSLQYILTRLEITIQVCIESKIAKEYICILKRKKNDSCHFDQKTKNEKWNEPGGHLMAISSLQYKLIIHAWKNNSKVHIYYSNIMMLMIIGISYLHFPSRFCS